ncbi:hypothetical protein F7725_019654, partial [Dissostichus mawsoni]
EGKKKKRRQKKRKAGSSQVTESRGPSREGTQGRHQTDFRPARDGISVYFNINDPGRKAASKPPTGAPAPLESEKPGSFNIQLSSSRSSTAQYRKEIDFCLEFVRSGNQKRDNGTPHGERLRGAISNQSARGLTNPSIVPPQPPAAHQHIRPPLSPTLMQRDLLSPTASFVHGSSSGSFSLTICPK